MIAVVKNTATSEQLCHFVKWIEDRGYKTNVSPGEEETIVGIIGDTSKIDPFLLESMDIIERVEILERLKALLAPCQFGSFTLASAPVHDRMIAFTSQLCHVVSNAYVKSPSSRDHHGFSAGSYRDLTRVARLNAPMWTELFLDNADYLSEELGTIIKNLQDYKDAIDEGDAERLEQLLADGDRIKREIEGR